MLPVDEVVLIAGVARRDPSLLAETHDRYYPMVLRFVMSKVGNLETAEDMASEVFVRLLEAVEKSRGPRKSLKGWLFCVAAHIINDYFRKRYSCKTSVEMMAVADSGVGGLDDEVIKKETLVALHGAIDGLTEGQQRVIQLRYGYEMSIRDVAAEMGTSVGAVKQLQARALAMMARRMDL